MTDKCDFFFLNTTSAIELLNVDTLRVACIISQCVFVAIWTVINEGNNRVHLHNDFNYLAIISGQTQVMYFVSSEWTSISRAPCQFSQIFIIENICFQYSFIKTFS